MVPSARTGKWTPVRSRNAVHAGDFFPETGRWTTTLMASNNNIQRILLLSLSLLVASVPAVAADAAKPAKKPAKESSMSLEDRKAAADEEKDRLAREKKDLLDREKALQGQLDTSKKLVSEKDALIKQMQAEIAALKAGKKDEAKAGAKADKAAPAK